MRTNPCHLRLVGRAQRPSVEPLEPGPTPPGPRHELAVGTGRHSEQHNFESDRVNLDAPSHDPLSHEPSGEGLDKGADRSDDLVVHDTIVYIGEPW